MVKYELIPEHYPGSLQIERREDNTFWVYAGAPGVIPLVKEIKESLFDSMLVKAGPLARQITPNK